DLPIVELNQHDDIYVILEPVLVDEDEDPKEEEFKDEEEPQEEDDMEVNIEEDDNEPELTYPYKEVDPLNPHLLASESEPEDVIEVEDTVKSEDKTVHAGVHEVGESSTAPFLQEDNDDLLSGLMKRDINFFFCRMTSLSRRLCGREMVHALVEKKEKVKEEYYGKLILDLGNEVRSSVEEGTAAMENLVRKLGNAKEKAECKKLKNELEEAIIIPPKSTPLTQAIVRRMIKKSVDVAIAAERARHANAGNDVRGSRLVRGQDAAPAVCEIMPPKSAPLTQAAIHRMIKDNVDVVIAAERARQVNVRNETSGSGPVKGAVELLRWFEKTKSVFRISECQKDQNEATDDCRVLSDRGNLKNGA
nr:hypothetical protein [Tanacetum cinerariifolium]